MSTIQSLAPENFLLKEEVKYEDAFKLHPIFDKLAFQANLVMVGPKGVGKTLAVQSWAQRNEVPIITYDCSEDIRRSNLVGSFILEGDATPFVLGPIPNAIRVANAVGKAVLVFEELNALTPQMQKLLNPLTDFRKRVEIPEAGEVFHLEGEAKLWVVGTMNTAVYGGVNELNEDLKSRFRMLPIPYPSAQQEAAILAKYANNPVLSTKLIRLAAETRQRATAYALSTRDLVQLLEDEQRVGTALAFGLMAGKFEGAERQFFSERVFAVFGVHPTSL